jgi:hypothetical protein
MNFILRSVGWCSVGLTVLFVGCVNRPAGLAGESRVRSIAGEWRLRLDPGNAGVSQKWFAGELPAPLPGGVGLIHLPGTTDEVKAGIPNPKPPSLDGLYRPVVYTGAAWYQREIEIPSTWQGKRVTLLLERNHWETRVWLDDRDCGMQDSLIAPHFHELGLQLTPGRHRLTIRVDNTLKLDLGRFAHINYEGTQTNWNGIIGRLELRATDPVAIDDVQIYPDPVGQRVKARISVNNFTGASVHGRLELSVMDRAGGQVVAGTAVDLLAESGTTGTNVEIPVGEKLRPWDEFSPVLYDLKVRLSTSGPAACADERAESFGQRDFGTKGTQFVINGRPLFLRGNVDNAIFPLTAYPAMEVAAWRRIFGIIKSYGLNHVRFHSWCPPEAAFAAADELGLYLQPEAPQANVNTGQVPARDAFIAEEVRRILRTYGNHPSFCLLTPGNELRGSNVPLIALVQECRETDPRHVYTSSTYGFGTDFFTANRQYTILSRARGIRGEGTDRDARSVVAEDSRPLISHEVGQHSVFPNLAEEVKYTGVLRPANFALIRADLAAKGLLPLAPQFLAATGQEHVLLYKEEIEAALRTPGLAGFQLLDLQDYPGQGTALVGTLDAFWDSKGLITPEAYRRFCSATVPLLRLKKRSYFADETLAATVDVAHFGPTDLIGALPAWSIKDERGHELASGLLPTRTIPTGTLTSLGGFELPLEKMPAPAKLIVTVSLQGTPYANEWDIWVYPPSAPVSPPPDLVIAHRYDQSVVDALATGKKVLLYGGFGYAGWKKGSFKPVFWSPVWFKSDPGTMSILCDPQHLALRGFPTEFYTNWQWWDLLNHSGALVLNDAPVSLEPIVRVIDNFARNDRLAAIFEAKVGAGRLLVSMINLTDDLAQRPAAQQLLKGLYRYLDSPAFQPKTELSPETLARIFRPAEQGLMQKLGAKVVHVDSEAGGRSGGRVLDGNPDTFWQTPWGASAPGFPHEIVIEFPTLTVARGIRILPTQDANAEGRIKDYAIYTSRDGQDWGQPIAHGTWAADQNVRVINFRDPIELKSIRLVAASGIDESNPSASVAEIEIIPAN